eukprot:6346502-Prymnesium_polylepis.2
MLRARVRCPPPAAADDGMMESLFKAKDADGDGTLDIGEFTSLIADCAPPRCMSKRRSEPHPGVACRQRWLPRRRRRQRAAEPPLTPPCAPDVALGRPAAARAV